MLKAKLKPSIRERKFFWVSLTFQQTLVPVAEVYLGLSFRLGGWCGSQVKSSWCPSLSSLMQKNPRVWRMVGWIEGSSGEAAGFSKVIRSVRQVAW